MKHIDILYLSQKEVIEVVEQGKFHIYPVATVEEGIQILTGRPAGTPDEESNYPEDTIYGAVQRKLQSYLEKSMNLKKKYGSNNNDEKE